MGIRLRKVHALAWNVRTLFITGFYLPVTRFGNKDLIRNTKVSRLFHILTPTSASGSTAGSRNLFNHYKTEEPDRIKPPKKENEENNGISMLTILLACTIRTKDYPNGMSLHQQNAH